MSALRGEMRGYLDRGYNVVKMKIGGAPIAEDRARIEAVLKEIGRDAQLAVDANGRFDLETAIAYARGLGQGGVGRERYHDDRLDQAAVERVRLKDDDGPPVPGLRTERLPEVGPPDLAPGHSHLSRRRTSRDAASRAGSGLEELAP